ncbi:hypothetical protein ACRAWG_24705 [Methylobacterium sp. P31]
MRYFIDHGQGDSIRGWIMPEDPRVEMAPRTTPLRPFASMRCDRIGIGTPVLAGPEAERLKSVKAVEETIVFDVAMSFDVARSDAVEASVDKSWS